MDKEIKKVLKIIENNGYEAYIVGGYVRDKLLNKKSLDIDICTNALPKDLYKLFPNNVSNSYGGFNITINKYNIDITTYRKELRYVGRKPVEIKYINNLIDDLERRDFTINSICMNQKGKIIDLLNGQDDINSKLIRCIGDEDKKLIEDPLRILRAIRFASVLNFKLDPKLEESIKRNASYVKTLPKEKIKYEFNKILISKNYLYGLSLAKNLGLLNILNIDFKDIIYSENVLVMWSQLQIDKSIFTNAERKTIINISRIIKYGKIDSKMLYKYGLYLCVVTGSLFNITKKDIVKMYNNMPINEQKKLAISSLDIINILNLKPGKDIQKMREKIINLILDKKLNNNHNDIIKYLEGVKKGHE